MAAPFNPEDLEIAANARNRILHWYNNRFPSFSKMPKSGLFHYTSADGLRGIIEQNELWATSAYFLNDSSEIAYGYYLLKEAFETWISRNEPHQETLCVHLAEEFQRSFGTRLERGALEPIYLFCCCEEPDVLSQWRAYAQSGYSCELDPGNTPSHGLQPQIKVYTSRWVKVVYERKVQIEICHDFLNSIDAILSDPATEQAISAVESHGIFGAAGILKILGDIFLEEIAAFKDKVFENEKEWRLVVRRRELMKQGSDNNQSDPSHLYFRSSHGMIVPYVKILPAGSSNKLPIKSIHCGPSAAQGIRGVAIRMMLEKENFTDVSVHESTIPTRF